jgi:hypothetical protein
LANSSDGELDGLLILLESAQEQIKDRLKLRQQQRKEIA